ncbi:Opacity protein LomR and related surface antigens [Edwardsiella anguillarum]|uniref:Outer membrane protein beta-barrel domain-containing protein n=5 Tax=Hafniaceae TaxID=1903412 RepID=A0A076LFQ6_9GAMM|nr:MULTISPECIES: Ail/Lom family outer membrane beta-barrel protein [Edwardsiella]GAJ67373.1 hypothetical protein MA13_contig00005-0153 [Edwardsiella piscicida]AIJ07355.1 Hypothetical protein ETEE_0886 [Edwardsiella anguillarum ET080813]AKR79457.2 outer membrane beta-barrel protein [Edwardsiella sp. LADL05-105]UOU78463.1 outer membrane beta-barrel protein [Edwardsiella anguillarum]WHP83179.1 outer membrane beta-barrel protein [Edwardsiella anguillarum]
MMKKMLVMPLIAAGFMVSTLALAETQTVSLGYAHIRPQEEKALNGAILGYQYEFDNDWGVLGNVTFAKGGRKETDDFAKGDFKYYSLMAGPTYRINEYISVYGQLGLAYFNAKFEANYDDGYSEHSSASVTALGWGAGFIVNPMDNLAITVGYEGSRFNFNGDNEGSKASTNGFNVSLGYRF